MGSTKVSIWIIIIAINLYELSEVTASIIKYTSMLITVCKNLERVFRWPPKVCKDWYFELKRCFYFTNVLCYIVLLIIISYYYYYLMQNDNMTFNVLKSSCFHQYSANLSPGTIWISCSTGFNSLTRIQKSYSHFSPQNSLHPIGLTQAYRSFQEGAIVPWGYLGS